MSLIKARGVEVMSKTELDTRDVLLDVLLGVTGTTQSTISFQAPALVGKRLWVFQVPSASTPNYLHFIVGSPSSGWRCSCVGAQAHGNCYHIKAVVLLFETLADERKTKRKNRLSPQPKRRTVRRKR